MSSRTNSRRLAARFISRSSSVGGCVETSRCFSMSELDEATLSFIRSKVSSRLAATRCDLEGLGLVESFLEGGVAKRADEA